MRTLSDGGLPKEFAHILRSSAVLVYEEDWQAIQETMNLLSMPGMRKSIRDGMAEPLSKSAKELDW